MVNLQLATRQASINDHSRLANMLYFESYVHRHLDWRTPLDWLGQPEYWVLEKDTRVVAALACPPDPSQIAWIRLFLSADGVSFEESWQTLWETAQRYLTTQTGLICSAIILQPWFATLLSSSGFSQEESILVLENRNKTFTSHPFNNKYQLRSMELNDIAAITNLDATAFTPLWRNSQNALESAYHSAGFADVVTYENKIVGYQISTRTSFGVHLARLAIHPQHQGNGLGRGLVDHLIRESHLAGQDRITVNTQSSNKTSLALYHKLGFTPTGEEYPVYTRHF